MPSCRVVDAMSTWDTAQNGRIATDGESVPVHRLQSAIGTARRVAARLRRAGAVLVGADEADGPPVLDDRAELELRRRLDRLCGFGTMLLDESTSTVFRTGGGVGPLGYDPAVDDVRVAERVHVDDLPAILALRAEADDYPDVPRVTSARVQHRDGHWLRMTVSMTGDPAQPGHVVVSWRIENAAVDHAESLFDSVPIALLAGGAQGQLFRANDAARELFGWGDGGLPVDTWAEHLGDGTARRSIVGAIASGSQASVEWRDGERALHAQVVPIAESHGWVLLVADVTGAAMARRAVHELTETQRVTLDALFDGVAVVGVEGRVRLANPAMHTMLGATPGSLVGKPLPATPFGPHPLEEWGSRIEAVSLRGDEPRRYRISHDRLPEGRHLFVVHDVTERERREHELLHQSLHDPLTGLPNRTLLMDRLQKALAREGRSHQHTAVLYIDLDRFKPVNDRHGHQAGDHVLHALAARLAHVCRATDTVGRIGGDEFVMVCESITDDDVAAICDRVIETLRQPVELPNGEHVVVGASIGVAVTADSQADADDVLIAADQALYRAKAGGDDHPRVVVTMTGPPPS